MMMIGCGNGGKRFPTCGRSSQNREWAVPYRRFLFANKGRNNVWKEDNKLLRLQGRVLPLHAHNAVENTISATMRAATNHDACPVRTENRVSETSKPCAKAFGMAMKVVNRK